MPRGRRGNHEGSIFRRKDGRWVARLFEGYDPEGRAKNTYFTGRTRDEVRERLLEAQARTRAGIPSSPERQTLDAYLDTWLEQVVRVTRRPRTYTGYSTILRLYIRPGLGKVQLGDLTAEQVQRVLNHWQRKGLSPGTVQIARTVLVAALNQAMRWDMVHRNVASLTTPPRARPYQATPFTPDEARRFVEHLEEHKERLGPMFVTTLALGLRIGEARALRWEDVDLEAGTIAVKATLGRSRTEEAPQSTKTSAGRRTLAIGDLVASALRTQRARQRIAQAKAGYRWHHTGYVFTSTVGTPVNYATAHLDFHRICRDAGLPAIRMHDLRHSAASLMLARGATLKEVADQLGHAGITITANLYGHWYDEQRRRLASIMDDVLQRR